MEEKNLTPEEEKRVKMILIGAGMFLCAYLGAKVGVSRSLKKSTINIDLICDGRRFPLNEIK